MDGRRMIHDIGVGVGGHPQAPEVAGQALTGEMSDPSRESGHGVLGGIAPTPLDSHFQERCGAVGSVRVSLFPSRSYPPDHVDEFGRGQSLDVAHETPPAYDPGQAEDVVIQAFPH